MANSTPAITDDERDAPGAPRPRDAIATRQLLLDAARRRFALDGYGSTTVRDIAADAGVNVALINRYFDSKEGLFEACLSHVAKEFDRPSAMTLEQVVESVVENVASSVADEQPYQLLLLLRSSGDQRADQIRLDTIRSFAERIAAGVGGSSSDSADEELLLRAQLAVAMALGIALLRVTGGGIPPLSAVPADVLAVPLRGAFSALLTRRG
ncbi:MAG TPA: TetR family transcriptional regulator [Pseudolysinimonas sp.]|jgi:AcrR family transcriptional regulator